MMGKNEDPPSVNELAAFIVSSVRDAVGPSSCGSQRNRSKKPSSRLRKQSSTERVRTSPAG